MLGVSKTSEGTHFSLFSKNATSVTLRLFQTGADTPFSEIPLKREGDIWSVLVKDLPETFEYTYRCDGPYAPEKGHFFKKEIDLLDPYAKRLNSSFQWKDPNPFPRGVFTPSIPFDWEDVPPPRIPLESLIVYEMHVRSFTNHSSSHVKHPGTFLGMIEKIPYLKELGINAVELLPIHMFNEREYFAQNPMTGEELLNYWGYSTSNFFTPLSHYGSPEDFKSLVKALHKAKIEVILDVVYNHTAEGADLDYYHSFRGIDNATYYMIDENGYFNYSGCGNTFNCNHPVVKELILASLRHFVTEYHVDGFRFDLASVLCRDENGHPMENPPLIDAMTKDPILSHTKLVAEPWDIGGLYQVGSFPSEKFGEWNDKFRDHIRCFIRGDGDKEWVKNRISGSPDIYSSPNKSYNFISIHDGFCLRDLVTYNEKHNEANGEENRDGSNSNLSWNCGVEGETDNPDIQHLRNKQIRNFFVALLLSKGIPMLLMGDEYGHTKCGNNNTWCQDNNLNYFLWNQMNKNRELFQFVSLLIHIRKTYFKGEKIDWHEIPDSPFLACEFDESLLIAFNPSDQHQTWHLPEKSWKRLIDTNIPWTEEILTAPTYTLAPYSAIVFIAS